MSETQKPIDVLADIDPRTDDTTKTIRQTVRSIMQCYASEAGRFHATMDFLPLHDDRYATLAADRITACGAHPAPMVEDGDFALPSVFMAQEEGKRLRPLVGRRVALALKSRRIPGKAANVIGQINESGTGRVVITAQIDTKINLPGALDNGTGADLLVAPDACEGIQWPQGDHSILVQSGCPTIASPRSGCLTAWTPNHSPTQPKAPSTVSILTT